MKQIVQFTGADGNSEENDPKLSIWEQIVPFADNDPKL